MDTFANRLAHAMESAEMRITDLSNVTGVSKAPKNKKNRIGKPFSAYPCGFLHVYKNKRMTGIEPAQFWPLFPCFMRFFGLHVETAWKLCLDIQSRGPAPTVCINAFIPLSEPYPFRASC